MSTKERLAVEAEERQEELIAAFFDALKTGTPEDLRRAQAAETIASRVFGRPVQPTRDDGPVELPADVEALRAMTQEERWTLLQSLPPLTESHVSPALNVRSQVLQERAANTNGRAAQD